MASSRERFAQKPPVFLTDGSSKIGRCFQPVVTFQKEYLIVLAHEIQDVDEMMEIITDGNG